MTNPTRGSDLSDADLERLAEITPEDVEHAKAAARRAGSPMLNALLDAEVEITPQVEREADVDAERFGSPLFRAMLDAVPVPEHPAADE